ncbi:MAG: ERF family protein [Verrucomicrobia bacterium]|nr:ERF family protein [Verrucomicrobiota bacterium]
MTKSESITHLAAKAQAEMPVAVFDATNPFLKSKYASLGAVIQASRPILAKHKLSLVQFPISGGSATGDVRHLTPALSPIEAERVNGAHGVTRPTSEMVGVESILTHESGEFVAERILIPLTEEKGKSKVQAAGSTLTYLRRYSWASILGMYSDEDSDGGTPSGRQDHGPQTTGPMTKPATALPPPPPVRREMKMEDGRSKMEEKRKAEGGKL